MSDSNPQAPEQQPQPQAAPQAPAAAKPPEAKTFTQRFQELERAVMQGQFVTNFHNQIIQNLMQQVQLLNSDIASIKQTLNAMLKLSDESKIANSTNTAQKMTEIEAESHRKALQREVEKGRLKVADVVAAETSIVSFSSDEILFGYNLVTAFQSEDVKKQMIGAKVGDKVGPYTVLGVYEEVAQPAPGDANAQASQAQDPTLQ